jgi:hypothetical protein
LSKRKPITQSMVNKMIKKGRGQGRGRGYLPWITIRDVSSKGFSHRIKGWKTGRVHHLLSNLERNFFFLLEWADNVTDIREKFPLLPAEKTLEIAQRLGINHPTDPKTGEPKVMTTDFLVNIKNHGNEKVVAFSVIPHSRSKGSINRTFLERMYWKEKRVDFTEVTEKDISPIMVENLLWLHPTKSLEFSPGLTIESVLNIESVLYLVIKDSALPLSYSCLSVDEELGLKVGTSLWVVRYLIANRYWFVDMEVHLDTDEPLEFQRNNSLIS